MKVLQAVQGELLLSFMKRKKIVWLCSWYPTQVERLNGDFIQRHARAASLINDIHVIYVGGHDTISNVDEVVYRREKGLTEHIILYKSRKGISGRFLNHLHWQKRFRQAAKDFIDKNGKPDIIHVHIPMKAGLIALWIKEKFGISYIVTEHWGIYNHELKDNYSSKPAWFKQITKKIFSNADSCASVSRYLADNIRKYVLKNLDFKIINNVADTSLFYPKEKQPGKFRFIHVSNMIPLKNAEGILSAFADLCKIRTDVELIMVGDKESSLHQVTNDLGLLNQSIFFRGEISYRQVAEEMQQADCLVLFSNIENSPCVIGEALCCGLPVISTHVGGITELLNEENSILVEPGNIVKLSEAMQEMISKYDHFNKKQIAESARNKFSYPIISKQFDELYQSAGR